jgi:hypothetical protein
MHFAGNSFSLSPFPVGFYAENSLLNYRGFCLLGNLLKVDIDHITLYKEIRQAKVMHQNAWSD